MESMYRLGFFTLWDVNLQVIKSLQNIRHNNTDSLKKLNASQKCLRLYTNKQYTRVKIHVMGIKHTTPGAITAKNIGHYWQTTTKTTAQRWSLLLVYNIRIVAITSVGEQGQRIMKNEHENSVIEHYDDHKKIASTSVGEQRFRIMKKKHENSDGKHYGDSSIITSTRVVEQQRRITKKEQQWALCWQRRTEKE